MRKTYAERFLRRKPALAPPSLLRRINHASSDWIVRHFVVTCSILALVCLAPSVLLYAQTTPGFAWRDFATLWGPNSARYEICWRPSTATMPEYIEYRRFRMEGGAPEAVTSHERSTFEFRPVQNEFCKLEAQLKKTGHFYYEMRGCIRTPTNLCSDWKSSMDATVGYVKTTAAPQGTPRAWAIYGYIAAPGPITPTNEVPVDQFRWINPNPEVQANGKESNESDRLRAEHEHGRDSVQAVLHPEVR